MRNKCEANHVLYRDGVYYYVRRVPSTFAIVPLLELFQFPATALLLANKADTNKQINK
jgi:hypothetical protein